MSSRLPRGRQWIAAARAVVATLSFLSLAPRVRAQTATIYSASTVQSAPQTEEIALYTTRKLAIGWNTTASEVSRPRHVFSSRVLLQRTQTQLYLHINEKPGANDVEFKMNQFIGDGTYVDVGGGRGGLFHTGFERGFGRPFGFGASYVRDAKHDELRGVVWRYWKSLGLFTGVRKANNRVFTIVSRPSEQGFAIRYADMRDVDTNYRFYQLVLGARSRPGYYGLNQIDSNFYLKDTRIVGQDPVNLGANPLRYIVPPLAWVVRDFGARVQYTDNAPGRVREAEVLKYLNDLNWVGLQVAATDSYRRAVRVNAGRTTGTFKFLMGIEYDTRRRLWLGDARVLWQPNVRKPAAK